MLLNGFYYFKKIVSFNDPKCEYQSNTYLLHSAVLSKAMGILLSSLSIWCWWINYEKICKFVFNSNNCMLAKSFVVCLIPPQATIKFFFLIILLLKKSKQFQIYLTLRNYMQSSRKISQKYKQQKLLN